jgi:hypothetical protein
MPAREPFKALENARLIQPFRKLKLLATATKCHRYAFEALPISGSIQELVEAAKTPAKPRSSMGLKVEPVLVYVFKGNC